MRCPVGYVVKMASVNELLLRFVIFSLQCFGTVQSYPEQGIRRMVFRKSGNAMPSPQTFGKTLFKGTEMTFSKVTCSSKESKPKIILTWYLNTSTCADSSVEGEEKGVMEASSTGTYTCDHHMTVEMDIKVKSLRRKREEMHMQPNHNISPKQNALHSTSVADQSLSPFISKEGTIGTRFPTRKSARVSAKTQGMALKHRVQPTTSMDGKGTHGQKTSLTGDTSPRSKLQPQPKHANGSYHRKQASYKTLRSGVYVLMVMVRSTDNKTDFTLEMDVGLKSKYGYLSASEWPLLPYYGVMSLVYLGYAVGWFVASCCNWRDLLRVQFWVCGVIALGMLENALFYTEFQNINITGQEATGLVIFAEVVSAVKRALARILVIIVSMGFGIVKPRLGPALHKILGTGLVYFILATVEGCLRATKRKVRPPREAMFAFIPLAVLDSIICWWIFTALVQTTRTLRIRKNVVKLSLYRHFTNTLIFGVLASIAYMIYAIKVNHMSSCKDWSELWLDDAFWPFLFAVILLVIMVLWRPTNNNQRYAFTPLLDMDEGDDTISLSEAFEGMKYRNMGKVDETSSGKKSKVDEDLKWVEENIPTVPATVLPTLDSDEELMTTNFEISKME